MTTGDGALHGVTRLLVLGLALVSGACTGTEPDPVVEGLEPDRFIDTYVDLRFAALTRVEGEITPEQREEILTRHGVNADELLDFVELRGRDAVFMQEVWDSVEVRFQRKRSAYNAGDTSMVGAQRQP